MSSHKKTIITVKLINRKENSRELYERNPLTYSIRNRDIPISGKVFSCNRDQLCMEVLDYLRYNPYSLVIFRNKRIGKDERILKETLDKIGEEHNNARKDYDLTLKLSKGKKYRRLKKIEHYLKKATKKK